MDAHGSRENAIAAQPVSMGTQPAPTIFGAGVNLDAGRGI